ncbi:MAG: STAS domain-containing protein [Chromatiales bacterium]|nr:STAS domain-containing protein [Chromatiales bacterium]
MRYEIVNRNGYAVVQLSGDVDMSTSPEVREAIINSLKKGEPVLVDLSGVTYIDSSGVASLVEGYQTARAGKLDFGLIGVSSAAMNVLQLARLDKVFPIAANVDEHIRAVG